MPMITSRPMARNATALPPALVLGSGITALGVMRSLGSAGIPTRYAADARDFSATSRWADVVPTRLTEFSGPAELADVLSKLDEERMVLIPCSDSWARTIASLEPSLAKRFPSSIAPLDRLHIMGDKEQFAALMTKHGIGHPQTYIIKSRADLESLPEPAFENAFLKPRNSQAFSARFEVKGFRVESRNDALARYATIEGAGLEVVMQEYIQGPPTNHFYVDTLVDRHGRLLAHFARQRLRMYTAFANSSALRSIPQDSAVAACSIMDRIVDALRPVRGMLSAELKLDPRDGELKVIEVNARAWKHIDFATQCGVNIARLAYEDALEQECTPITEYVDDARCVDLYHDVPNFFGLLRAREITVREWVTSIWGAREPIATLSDPVPAIWRFSELASGWVRSRLGAPNGRPKRW
jgi:predicted ATP-grasp superfamily ATP-dependent carboligase